MVVLYTGSKETIILVQFSFYGNLFLYKNLLFVNIMNGAEKKIKGRSCWALGWH